MDLDVYLKRLKYSGDLSPNLQTLSELQKAHLLNIPFENLDIHTDTEIILEPNHLYNKIILRLRGGFCYELNGLFYSLLKDLGFDVKMVSARVFSKDKGYGPDRDHLALIVRIDGIDYLSDVGFGDFILAPLRLELNSKQQDETGIYSIDVYNEYYRVNKIVDDIAKPNYIFTLESRELADFNEMCRFQQFDPSSNFIKKKKITKATANGRIYLDEGKLSILENGLRTEYKINSAKEFDNVLEKFFKK